LVSADQSNQLLAALPADEFELMKPHLADLELSLGEVLFNPGDIIRDVYFPTTAIVSMMNVMRDGQKVEVAAVGHEGMVGIRMFFDDDEAFAHAMCQAPGQVLKMDAQAFWAMVKAQAGVRHVVHHYVHAFLFEVFQSAGCNKVHTIPQRFARWILQKQDRARTNSLLLPRELVADMLTITPASAHAVLNQFVQERFIDYRNTVVEILNRTGLEAMACECYERVGLEWKKIAVKRQMRAP
jgi:CRP-like cAMP-binding protein